MFEEKILLVTGGTGSFGNAVVQNLLFSGLKEIRIFSRDEKKQDDMRKRYNSNKLKFFIGDTREYESMKYAIRDVDFVFHAAALKQVPSCEFYPMQAYKTNVIGTSNVIENAIEASVSKVVCLSTDKAVYPINAMGLSKAMMEKLMISHSRMLFETNTTLCATRYGNVMGSRGSVIPLFINQILTGNPITITDPAMTRFMMSLKDSVSLVLHAFNYGQNGDIFVQKSPSSTLETLVEAIVAILKRDNYPTEIIGIRHGEKLYETLLSSEEIAVAEDMSNYFRVPADSRDLNYADYFEKGELRNKSEFSQFGYNSSNTNILNTQSMIDLLLKENIIDDIINSKKLD